MIGKDPNSEKKVKLFSHVQAGGALVKSSVTTIARRLGGRGTGVRTCSSMFKLVEADNLDELILKHYSVKSFAETATNLDSLRGAIHTAANSLAPFKINSCGCHQTNNEVEVYLIATTISKFVWRIIHNGKLFTEEANKVLNQVALSMTHKRYILPYKFISEC